jgi:hypothetical protein
MKRQRKAASLALHGCMGRGLLCVFGGERVPCERGVAVIERIHRILTKLEQARREQRKCFGSDAHSFRLKTRLPEEEVSAFESRQGIRLPEDFRQFVLHAGNGGAGPYYGLIPLILPEKGLQDESHLAEPCPLTPAMARTQSWVEELGYQDEDACYSGTMVIGTHGCTYDTLLVITGEARGRVVYVHYGEAAPYFVADKDFLSWYERWLDELLQGYKIDGFGYGPAGGENDFFRILNDPQANEEMKSEAAFAFCRLPRLSDAGALKVPLYCRHSVSGVRSGACATIRGFKIQKAADEAARLLDDPSPQVRQQAVWTVMDLDPRRWTGAVLHHLRADPDVEVATSAFFKLEKAGALPKPELLQIIEHSTKGNLRYLAANKVVWSAEDLDLLIRMLADANTQVRFEVTLGLRRLNARSALPQVLDLLAREKDALVIGSILKMLGEFADPSTVTSLLEWTRSADDFHRLDAIEALAKIGDERALPIAQAMLLENRPPVRRDASGGTSSIYTIRDLVRKSLQESPKRALRQLAK